MNPIPEAYKSYIRQDLAALLPDGEVDTLISALETTEPSVAIRLNPLKTGSTGASGIAAMQMADCQVAWCPQGWHLSERPDFTHDPAMHQGRYYVQDASSMIISCDAIPPLLSPRPDPLSRRRPSEHDGVEIRLYSVIYQAIEEVKDAMAGMLAPEVKEEITGFRTVSGR